VGVVCLLGVVCGGGGGGLLCVCVWGGGGGVRGELLWCRPLQHSDSLRPNPAEAASGLLCGQRVSGVSAFTGSRCFVKDEGSHGASCSLRA